MVFGGGGLIGRGRGIAPDSLMTLWLHTGSHNVTVETCLGRLSSSSGFPPTTDGRVFSARVPGLSARLDPSVHESARESAFPSFKLGELSGWRSSCGRKFWDWGEAEGGSLQVHALFDALERWHRGWQMDLRLLSDLKVWWLQVEGHMVV